MKQMIILLINLLLVTNLNAHDGGHGPKLVDSGKYGGVVSAVVLKSEMKKGTKANLVNKAELVRSSDGTLRVYLYDLSMNTLNTTTFESKATAVLITKFKKKLNEEKFELELKDGVFIGKLPTPKSKPYDVDVTLKNNGTELLTAFDRLD